MTVLETFDTPILFVNSYEHDGRNIIEIATRDEYIGLYKDEDSYHLAHRIKISSSEVPIASFEYKGKILRIHRAKSSTKAYLSERTKDEWVFREVSFDKSPRSINGAFFDREILVTVSVVDADFDPRSRVNIYKIKGVQRFEHVGKTVYSDEFTTVDLSNETLIAGTKKGIFLVYKLKSKMLKSEIEVLLQNKARYAGSIVSSSILSSKDFILGTSRGELILAEQKKEIESTKLSIEDAWEGSRSVKGKISSLVKLSERQRKYLNLDLIAGTAEIHHFDGKAEATGGVIEVSLRGDDTFQLNFIDKPLKIIHPYMKDLIYVQIDSQDLEVAENFFD